VTRQIKKYFGDFIAIIALVVVAFGIGGYILKQERLQFPFIDKKPFKLKAEFANAQAVQPGQGQTVRTAGVEVGSIGKVTLKDGKALVEMDLKPKYKGLVRKDATALLRTKTGLQDVFIELDPGTGKPLKENATVSSNDTAPETNPDEVLSALDTDTRDYLKLLISGGGKGLKGHGNDLRETFRRFEPLHRDVARVTSAIAERRRNLQRLIHNYGLLTTELADKDHDLTRLVSTSNAVLGSFAAENQNVSSFVAKLPGTLRVTQRTLGKVDSLGQKLGPTLEDLRPPFRQLASTNKAVLPFVKEATPILRKQIRPFARVSQPYTKILGQAGKNLNKASPDLTSTFLELNRLFNIGAFNPGGAQGLTGNQQVDRNRQEGYLYWLAWTGQNTVSLFNTSDAQGPFRRIYLGGLNCATLTGIAGQNLSALPAPLVTVANNLITSLGTAGVCVP
jgi:phospholipid/cholesterol/gamma-HCH transport system substrate-binding protein